MFPFITKNMMVDENWPHTSIKSLCWPDLYALLPLRDLVLNETSPLDSKNDEKLMLYIVFCIIHESPKHFRIDRIRVIIKGKNYFPLHVQSNLASTCSF